MILQLDNIALSFKICIPLLLYLEITLWGKNYIEEELQKEKGLRVLKLCTWGQSVWGDLRGEVGNQQKRRMLGQASPAREKLNNGNPHPEVFSHVCLCSFRTSVSLCSHCACMWGESTEGMGNRFGTHSSLGLNLKHLFHLPGFGSLLIKTVNK